MIDKGSLAKYLLNVVKAADPEDDDDVAIRTLLVSALRDMGADLNELLDVPAVTAGPPLVNPADRWRLAVEGRPERLEVASNDREDK
jgi:hypothetical protein